MFPKIRRTFGDKINGLESFLKKKIFYPYKLHVKLTKILYCRNISKNISNVLLYWIYNEINHALLSSEKVSSEAAY